MSSALANRFTHFYAVTDLEDWSKWAIANDIEPVVIAFIRFRPELLHQFSRTEKAYPTPRSWSFVSRIVKKSPGIPAVEHALFSGAVGVGAASEFSAFIRLYRQMPSLDGILLNPDSALVPDEPSALYAVSAGLARRANAGNIARVMQYAERMPEEYNVLTIKLASACTTTGVTSTREFTSWCVKHADVTF
jgi:hypothetical protein